MSDKFEKLVDLELEQRALGTCLLKPAHLLSFDLVEAHFYSPSNALIWRELKHLHATGIEVNTPNLRSRLLDEKKLLTVGGDDYLLGLTDTVPCDGLSIERLKRLARGRAIYEGASQVAAHALEDEPDQAIAALGDTHTAALTGASRNKTENILELCAPLLEELGKPPKPGTMLHPGYAIMADKMGLITIPTTIGILADTNVGKSTFAIETIVRMAMRNIVTGYVSVEDQKTRVRARMLGMFTGISSRRILQHNITREDWPAITSGFTDIDRLKNHLHTSILQGATDADVCASMNDLAHRGSQAVVVDYLQKITPSSFHKNDSKAARTADMCSRITSQAQRLGLVTFILSQCKRDKDRQNQCPSKHDMKESGDLENMLDFVIGLWREYEDDHAPIWVRLIKTKDGGLGGSWCLQRQKNGRLEEVPESVCGTPPDPKDEWKHRSRGKR